MTPWIRISCSDLTFSASHFITFDAEHCEAVHGHDYRVAVRVEAAMNAEGYTVDFEWVRRVVRELVAPWDHHILLPTAHPRMRVLAQGATVEVLFGDRRWVFPKGDCVLLPVSNTTAEQLSRLLAEQFRCRLAAENVRILAGELDLSEAPGYSAGWAWTEQPRPID